MFPGERLPLLSLDVSPRLQVALVAYQHDHHVRVGVLPGVLQPRRQVVERVPVKRKEKAIF